MAKLFGIFAAQAPVAVLLRRGPSGWYHVIRWDVERDAFERGAWIKGRIYEALCDVSPDGELLLYHVFQGSRGSTSFSESYTAVSRLPWLQALALWPNSDGRGPPLGGGRFVGGRALALRDKGAVHPDVPLVGLSTVPGPTPIHEDSVGVEGADWSGRDRRNRLCFSIGGKLFRRVGDDDVLIADFEDLVPDPQPAPEWAGKPLNG